MDPQQYGQQPSGQPGYGAPPGYGQQQQYGAPPPPAGSTSRWGPTSLGMEPNVAAGLSYIAILGLIFFFVEKTNRFVKFHAAQVILLAIVGTALWIVESIVVGFLFAASVAASNTAAGLSTSFGIQTLVSCLFGLAFLGLIGLWLWGIISAFQGKYTKLPIIGDIAEKWAGGPPVPAF